MKDKTLFYILLLVLYLLSFPVSADVIYNNYVLPQLSSITEIHSKEIYYPGEDINAAIKISYSSPYYLPDALLVVQLIRVYEEGSIYPSDIIDQNVFYEKVYKISLKPGDVINVSFNYRIPADIEEGKYYLVTYLYTPLSYISGLPFIFLPGNYKEIYIKSGRFEGFPYVRIYRKESKINFENPTIGVSTTDFVNLRIAILSDIDTKAKIIVKYAPWDDISRNITILSEETVNLNKGLNYINFNYNFGFLNPNAYSIRVEIYVNETLQSLYRFRFIKSGPTALLRGILLDKNRDLIVIIGPSPDHYNYPTTKKVSLLIQSEELKYNKEIYVGDIEYHSTGFIYVNLSLNDIFKDSFDVCAYLYSESKLTDFYCIKYFGVKPKPFLNISFIDGILKINTTVNGLLILDSLNENKTYSYQISTGLTEIPLNYGKYFLTFVSDEIYLEKEIEYQSKERRFIITLDENMLSLLLIVLFLLILIIIIMVMIKILLKGKKELLKVIILLLGFIFFSKVSYSLKVSIEDRYFCSINGSIEINIVNEIDNYRVFLNLYDNKNLIYEDSYLCKFENCNLYVKLPNLYPKNYTLHLLIETQDKKLDKYYEEFNYTTYALYPYDIKLPYKVIYAGAMSAVIIENVSKCQNILNYTNTYFNFTYNSTPRTYTLLRNNCPYSGDPEWGERMCGIDVSNLQPGFYEIYANYTIGGFRISQFVGTLEVRRATHYIFSKQNCTHAWSAQGQGVQYNYRVYGKYVVDEDFIVLANNSKFSIENINSINYLCSNAVLSEFIARIFGFVYKYSDLESTGNYSKGVFVYGRDNSIDSFGEEVGNIMLEAYKNSKDRGFIVKSSKAQYTSFDLYTFGEGYYTVFINKVNAICDSPMIFVCPSTEGNNVCRVGIYQNPTDYIGWRMLNSYKILVPFPNVSGTYTNAIEGYVYFDKTNKKWYLFITNYKLESYGERLNYRISNEIPLDSIIVGRFRNIGYGKLNISVNGSNFRISSTIKDNEVRTIYANFTEAIIKNCYKRNCVIKYDLKYSDAYNLVGEFNLADPYINIKWNNISLDLVKPGYLLGNFITLILNITNLDPVIAQNISLLSHNASRCVSIYGSNPIDIPPYESKTYQVFVVIKDPSCSPENYIVNLKIGGINTLDAEITVDILDYARKIFQYKKEIVVEERIYIVGILLTIILILLLL